MWKHSWSHFLNARTQTLLLSLKVLFNFYLAFPSEKNKQKTLVYDAIFFLRAGGDRMDSVGVYMYASTATIAPHFKSFFTTVSATWSSNEQDQILRNRFKLVSKSLIKKKLIYHIGNQIHVSWKKNQALRASHPS